MRASCEVCRGGMHKACAGYRGPLQTYLCGCYERNAEADPGMHPLTYEGRETNRTAWRLSVDGRNIDEHDPLM